MRSYPLLFALCAALAGAAPLLAQSEETDRLIREGKAEELETRLRGGKTADEQAQIAAAYRIKVRTLRSATDRQRAIDKSAEFYRKAIDGYAKSPPSDDGLRARVRLAVLRVEYAGMLMSLRIAPAVDEFALTAGEKIDRERTLKTLAEARELYLQGDAELSTITSDMRQYEEELLEKGLKDPVQQAGGNAIFYLGWCHYYLGLLEARDARKRAEYFQTAEKRFQQLIDSGDADRSIYLCYLGIAMAQREQGQFESAERNFALAMQTGVDPATEIQVRYERARAQLAARQFDEARATLRSLVEKDPNALSPDERPARFYINLAQIWDANSYLLEDTLLRAEAANSPAATAILQKAERARQQGMAKMGRLAKQGGPWPGLVRIYVAQSIDLRADPRRLSPTELLYSGAQLNETRRYRDAQERLLEAAGRPELDPELLGEILFELGRAQYSLQSLRAAAETFARLAVELKNHARAPQAATFAYQLWAKVARESRKKEDYQRLADVLLNLLQSYPQHEQRDEAMFWLPVALQQAGKVQEAIAQFAAVPRESPRWEEAQYRRVQCGKLLVEAQRGAADRAAHVAKAKEAAAALTRYADESLARAEKTAARDQLERWSADARIQAAELLAAPDVEEHQAALDALSSFEQKYPKSAAIGRVLGVRIRAYRGLRDFDKASQTLTQYLANVKREEAGGVLALLAKGMQEEVERLRSEGDDEAARRLASESAPTFQELGKWVESSGDAALREKHMDAVLLGLARMQFYAGDTQPALEGVRKLLEKSPKSGDYQQLLAQVLTAQLGEKTEPAEVAAARAAWETLLADPAIRQRAPERYWEARYSWLDLTLRGGNAKDVAHAIQQERIWYPDLGGEEWRPKFEALYERACQAAGIKPEDAPASAPAAADETPAAEKPGE